jgi:hypothetical protein
MDLYCYHSVVSAFQSVLVSINKALVSTANGGIFAGGMEARESQLVYAHCRINRITTIMLPIFSILLLRRHGSCVIRFLPDFTTLL